MTAVLKAQVSQFTKGIAEAQRSLEGFEKSTGGMMQAAGTAIAGVGKGLTLGITVPMAAMATASAKSAMDFESAMKGV